MLFIMHANKGKTPKPHSLQRYDVEMDRADACVGARIVQARNCAKLLLPKYIKPSKP